MKYCSILQLRNDAPDRHYKAFIGYNTVKKEFGKVDINDYQMVWFGKVSDHATFEDIFAMCNLNHPEGYHGHSLSVSDIVYMDGKVMYCDEIGFTEVEL